MADERRCVLCFAVKAPFNINYFRDAVLNGSSVPGNPEIDYLCRKCFDILYDESQKRQEERRVRAQQKSIAKAAAKFERIKTLGLSKVNRIMIITLASGARYEISPIMLHHAARPLNVHRN